MTQESETPARLSPTPLETFLQATKDMPLVGDNDGLAYHSALIDLISGNRWRLDGGQGRLKTEDYFRDLRSAPDFAQKFQGVRVLACSRLVDDIKHNREVISTNFHYPFSEISRLQGGIAIMGLLGLDQLEGKAGEGAKKLISAAEAEIQKNKALQYAREREALVLVDKTTTPEPITPEPVKVEDQSEDQRLKEQQRREREFIDKVLKQGECLLTAWTSGAGMGFIPQPGKEFVGIIKNWADKYMVGGMTIEFMTRWKIRKGYYFDQLIGRNNLEEFVLIRPLEKNVLGTRKVKKTEVRKGWFRDKRVEVEADEDFVSGQVPMTVKEAIGYNSDEEAFVLQYLVTGRGHGLPYEVAYKDGGGRRGNSLDLSVVIPRSLALDIDSLVKNNPLFIRDLVFKMIYQRYSPQFINQVMRKYGTPPFEAWEKYHQPGMYFVDVLANPPEDKNQGLDSFDPSKIIRFNTREMDGYKFAVRE